MPVSQTYVRSKGRIGQDLYALCKFKHFLCETLQISQSRDRISGQSLPPAVRRCSSFLLLNKYLPQNASTSNHFYKAGGFLRKGRKKKRFKALFAAVPADCHSWLWKGGGSGGHRQPVAAVHIFLGHGSRVRDKSLYSQPCLK